MDRRPLSELPDFVSRNKIGLGARVTQITNLLNLAQGIQEEILFLPRTVRGEDGLGERALRPIAAELDWRKQRAKWMSRLG